MTTRKKPKFRVGDLVVDTHHGTTRTYFVKVLSAGKIASRVEDANGTEYATGNEHLRPLTPREVGPGVEEGAAVGKTLRMQGR